MKLHIPAALAAILLYSVAAYAEPNAQHPGAAIYKKQCAECHGPAGEGVDDEYDEPLYGDRSLASLTRLITRTMPEDDAPACVGEDAAQVAAYIYHAFYSPQARAHLNPPRIALSRLTVPQYRESIADLVGKPWKLAGAETGLSAEYFDSKGMNKKNKSQLKRIDSSVDFDFGKGPPAKGMDEEQFSIAWEGSIRARETGHYEFRISTPNGARLYVNATLRGARNYRDDSSGESEKPLIDSWVSSGDEVRVETARIFLLGGRDYSFLLDYFKYKEKKGSIRLEWKPPHGAWSVPAASDFSPSATERIFVVKTPFPADDRSLGYERGTSVSREWIAAVTSAAIEVADEIEERLPNLALVNPKAPAPERAAKLKTYAAAFAERAFRRPLTGDEQARYLDAPFSGAPDPELGLRRAVLAVLQSPLFLYPEPGLRNSETHRTAARLALALWDSLPDGPLLNVARNGNLARPQVINAQARRMLKDPRARNKLHGFFHHWLEMDGERDLLKNAEAYPAFDATAIADLRHSLNLFVDEVAWSEASDYRQLLLADHLLLNEPLAQLYGVEPPARDFTPVAFDPSRRAGVLTHPYLLSAFAYPDNSSPILRGVFLTRHIVGRPLKPPPIAVAFKDADFKPDMTMREKVTELTRDAACMGCHSAINPLGFSLENFDAIGRWRTKENNKPVNAKSDYETQDGVKIRLEGARDIAEFAAGSKAAHRAFVTHLFDHTIKQPTAAYGEGTLEKLREKFAQSDFSIQQLLLEIAILAASHEDQNS